MPKHWANDYYSEGQLDPQEGDEELFLTIQLLGVEQLARQFSVGSRHDPIAKRDAIEHFCKQHHRQGEGAAPGSWVRYDLWLERQKLTASNN